MTKRASPFGDMAPLQWKVYVTQRELSEGVLGEKYKREVYEKTKTLLFNGAQSFMGDLWTSNLDEKYTLDPILVENNYMKEPESICNSDHDFLQGQTFLGQNGQLLRGLSYLQKSSIKAAVTNCFICLKPSNFKKPCSRCDHLLCQDCIKVCDHCTKNFCSICSVADYNDAEDKVFCYDCVS
ncbi:apoptosis regulatory protein Siva-like [Hypanus sabinus]|uniref:apoptosis regulatory protein Siva-like n=1 Tax=Hypanus sabinus TaxID=79690 RepID=UPI0028C4FBF3|nr:apoptosis regulatory protein Siva-like [Hypanus sabinus]